MANIELEQGMKNHPGFMPFTHCNTNTNEEPEKTEKKASEDNSDE